MMSSNKLQKLMNKERYIRHGALMLNLLRYDVEWVVRRWGYFDTKSTCEYFEFVVSLFKEVLGEEPKKGKKAKEPKPEKKTDDLPVEESETPAIVPETEAAVVTQEESL